MSKDNEKRTNSRFPSSLDEVIEDSVEDESREYLIKFRDKEREDVMAKGFLAVAQSFIAVGRSQGDVQIIVPLEVLQMCQEVERPHGSA